MDISINMKYILITIPSNRRVRGYRGALPFHFFIGYSLNGNICHMQPDHINDCPRKFNKKWYTLATEILIAPSTSVTCESVLAV